MRLDPADIEQIATRVVRLLCQDPTFGGPRLVDAATVARLLGVDREWVYAHSVQLGAVRLGDGPRGRLRFDLDALRDRLVSPARPTSRARSGPFAGRPNRLRSPKRDKWPGRRANAPGPDTGR